MTTNDIRKKFLEFFRSKGHTVIASDSLVPKDDPTVLFTTAGMQQFKPQFLGRIDGYTRAASCQKCLRTDDLDVVGKTDCHHTFFEMLGNFSFGDYFKKDAIIWAWEFMTDVLKVPQERLWVSVYKDDAEAESIWLNEIRLPKERLVRLGDKSNFWPSNAKEVGPNGPCGPCSEIFYDYGVNPKCTNKNCDPDCSCGRFTEVWNLVFTQYNRKDGGVLEPLPAKNIDTGMGLERLAAVIQGKKSNYETDLFEPILKEVKTILPKVGTVESRIIADHMRAVTFGIADGVVTSNEGRGYVIKKLIINISDLAVALGAKEPVGHQLVHAVVESMKFAYPELLAKEFEISSIIRGAEEAYLKVRKERLPEFEGKVKEVGLSDPLKLGKIVFAYRDTFGLTMPTIERVLRSLNIKQDILDAVHVEFNRLMAEQQSKSRASSKMTGDVFAGLAISLDVPKTKFVGYDHESCEGTVLKIFKDGAEAREARDGDTVKIILDTTVFYAESGGQIGDTGTLWAPRVRIRVTDTQKANDIFIHDAVIDEGSIKIGDKLGAQIDDARRLAIMRNHTATHLLQAVLREILGPHVKQQGSLVADDRLRFDFTHAQGIGFDEIKMIEDKVNRYILGCHEVKKEVLSIEKAKQSGALAFFAEKYGDTVRVVTIGPFSKEFCGGTHLKLTGQIGPFKIISESAVAQGIRRIEALTGMSTFEYLYMQENELKRTSVLIKAPELEVSSHVDQLAKRLKELEKETDKMRLEVILKDIDKVLTGAASMHGVTIVTHVFSNATMDILRKVCDSIKQRSKSAVIVLGSQLPQEAHLLISVTEDVISKGLSASELIKEIAPLMGGSGGGRPQMAQAGSKSPQMIPSAVERAEQLIKGKL